MRSAKRSECGIFLLLGLTIIDSDDVAWTVGGPLSGQGEGANGATGVAWTVGGGGRGGGGGGGGFVATAPTELPSANPFVAISLSSDAGAAGDGSGAA